MTKRMTTDEISRLRTEGEPAVEILADLVEKLGYKGRQLQFRNGAYVDSLTDFLADNPGCMEAIYTWISDNASCWPDALTEKPEELVSYEVEYDLGYSGGEYSKVGETVVVLAANDDGVEAAFKKKTGHDPVHIVHFSFGEPPDLDEVREVLKDIRPPEGDER